MIVQDYLNKWYGAPVRSDEQPLTTSIATTPTRVVANDPTRVHFYIINTGTNDINIYPSNTVSSTVGIRLAANGGSIVFKAPDNGNYSTLEWYAAGIGGASTITFGSSRFLS